MLGMSSSSIAALARQHRPGVRAPAASPHIREPMRIGKPNCNQIVFLRKLPLTVTSLNFGPRATA